MAPDNPLHYTNVDVAASRLHLDHWVVRDLYQRILTGELLDPADARELLRGYLEDGECHAGPLHDATLDADAPDAAALDGSAPQAGAPQAGALQAGALQAGVDGECECAAEFVETTIRSIWNAAHDTARAWEAERTDTDRFYEALLHLFEDEQIEVLLYSSIFDSIFDSAPDCAPDGALDGAPRPGRRGVASIAADAWRYFDDQAARPITVTVDSRDLDILISEIALDVAAAFSAVGLVARIDEDFTVIVTARWRHHVLSHDEAQAAARLLP